MFRTTMIQEAEVLCGLGFTEENLATYWLIRPQTLNRWKRKNPHLSSAIEKGRVNANVSVTKKLFNRASEGNLGAIVFWLTNRCPDLWKDQRFNVHNTNINSVRVDANTPIEHEREPEVAEQMRAAFERFVSPQ